MIDAVPDVSSPWAVQRGRDIRANDDDVWPWWSITKTILAVAVLRLGDQGRAVLDEPTRFHPATLRQLLTHTGGVASYTRLSAYRQAVEERASSWTIGEMLARVAEERDDFPPGQGWSYSNTGYAFVRCAIEETLDESIASALNRLVFYPLGLHETAIVLSADDDRCPVLRAERYDPGWVYHGLACGTAEDAVRFLDRVFAADFLSAEARNALTVSVNLGGPVPNRPWASAAYGLGVMCGEMTDRGRVLGHSGGGPFSVSAAYRVDDAKGRTRIACAFAKGTDEGRAEWIVHGLFEPDGAEARR